MNEITTIDTNNYAAMAKAMGIANEGTSASKKSSTLARLRIHHTHPSWVWPKSTARR